MLSRLSKAASRTFTSTIEVGGRCSATLEDGELLNLNLEELYLLVRPLPQLAWSRVSDICTRTVAPVYNAISSTLQDDVEQLARLFVDLELASASEQETYFEPAERDVLPPRLQRCQSTGNLTTLPSLPPRRRRRSSVRVGQELVTVCLEARRHGVVQDQDQDQPLVIKNDDPTIPTIVITPCPSLPREVECLVPYQDAAFGNQLPVPTHPVLNDVFPPLVAKPFPLVERWRYEDGHWHAQLPPVQEQMSKGMFSRPLSTRRQRALDAGTRMHSSRRRTCYSRSHREG